MDHISNSELFITANRNVSKLTVRIANSLTLDPDETALLISSGSTLFAKTCYHHETHAYIILTFM